MEPVRSAPLRFLRRARGVFMVLYGVAAGGFLYAAPGSGWTWFIVGAGAALCGLVVVLVNIWTSRLARKARRTGADHG